MTLSVPYTHTLPHASVLLALLALLATGFAQAPTVLPTPPAVRQDFDPDKGDFKEEIVTEETRDGVYHKDAYISAYVNEVAVRVFCRYAVKGGGCEGAGATSRTLMVSDGGDGRGGDHASWAEVYLTPAVVK